MIPFFFFLIFCGIPLYFLELCLGQFSGVSSIFVWKLCPLFKGKHIHIRNYWTIVNCCCGVIVTILVKYDIISKIKHLLMTMQSAHFNVYACRELYISASVVYSCSVSVKLVLYTLFFRVGIFDGHSVSNDVMVLHHCSGLGPILPRQFFLSPPPMV